MAMLQKICFLVNYNLYESKRHFTQKLAEACQRRDIDTHIIDVNEGVLGGNILAAIREYSPTMTCSFNTILPISETQFLWDALQIPHLAIIVDPVLYSMNLIRSPYSIMTCVDRSDCRVLAPQFKNAFFWPHAVERELTADDLPRTYDVVFLGSCYDYESLRASWRQRNPEAINQVLDDAIDLVFSDPKISLAQALAKAWGSSKLDPAGVDFTSLFYYLDNYTRGKDRVELIRSIKNAQVHVFGELSKDNAVGVLGWQQYLASKPNIVLHPSVPFHEIIKILQQSKICLNSTPFFKEGSHERVFMGLGCGAVPITTENGYFREIFNEEEDIFFYQMNAREKADELIANLLADENKRCSIAKRGRSKVMAAHTWDCRVDQLIANLDPILLRISNE
jgi:hypothetical protein